MGLQKWIAAGLLTLLISTLIGFYLNGLGTEYGADLTDIQGEKFDFTKMDQTLNDANNTVTSFKDALKSWNPILIGGAIFNFGLNILDFIIVPFQLIFNLFKIFSIPNIVIVVLVSLLTISIIFAVIKLLKIGED